MSPQTIQPEPYFKEGRFFISPILGCPAGCGYCYIYEHGLTGRTVQNSISATKLIGWLKNHKDFKPGKTGSVLAIGSWGDPFPRGESDITIEYISSLAQLGNPIQVCTKYFLSDDTVSRILNIPCGRNQIVLSTTVVSFSYWESIEPGADPPEKRLMSLARFRGSHIRTNLMIKPYFPGITNLELDIFKSKLKQYKVDSCVVGIFYWTSDILNRIRQRDTITYEALKAVYSDGIPGELVCLPNSSYNTYYGNVQDSFVRELATMKEVIIFKNATCVSSYHLRVPHVSRLWKEDPLRLCVKCGNCEGC